MIYEEKDSFTFLNLICVLLDKNNRINLSFLAIILPSYSNHFFTFVKKSYAPIPLDANLYY